MKQNKHLFMVRLVLIGVFLASILNGNAVSAGGSVSPYYGSFSTEVPIAVPDFHGLDPNLKLVYNSGGGNSWVGVGWSLSGFSVVERSSPEGGTPLYDEDDIFFLDGMELVPCTSQGGTHCAKVQNYTRIRKEEKNWYVVLRSLLIRSMRPSPFRSAKYI